MGESGAGGGGCHSDEEKPWWWLSSGGGGIDSVLGDEVVDMRGEGVRASW